MCHHHFIQSGVIDMAESENLFAKVAGSEQTAEEQKRQLEEKIQNERETLGGPTIFVNRQLVQIYPDSGYRITFGEQYSNDLGPVDKLFHPQAN
jgi:hypothetical protein